MKLISEIDRAKYKYIIKMEETKEMLGSKPR